MKGLHRYILAGAVIAVAVVIGSCQRGQYYHNMQGVDWHTTFSVTYLSDRNLNDSVTAAMHRVEKSLSAFDRSSLVSAVNNNETDVADKRLETVINESRRLNRISAGAFDPTVAPLVNLWGFGPAKRDDVPTQAEIDSCLHSVGMLDCMVKDGRVIKKTPETRFDFSAIAKGYGCDEVAEALQGGGCYNYMVEIGGEIRVKGEGPSGDKWRIMIDAPVSSASGDMPVHESLRVIEVTNCGIATSGNYRNYRETSQGRVGHTISPLTGRPMSHETLSVTVIAPTAMTADALATAAMAMPFEKAKLMIENEGPGTSALFVLADTIALDSAPWRIYATRGFPLSTGLADHYGYTCGCDTVAGE